MLSPLDDRGRILWVSPSLTTLLGWRPEDWVGQIGTQFRVHPGRSEAYEANRNLLRSTAGATTVGGDGPARAGWRDSAGKADRR